MLLFQRISEVTLWILSLQTRICLSDIANMVVTVGEDVIKPVRVARNLGYFMDSFMTGDDHVRRLCAGCINLLRKIRNIRHLITFEMAQVIVQGLVLSRLDYCNSLFMGMSQKNLRKLQVIQNNCARVIYRAKPFEHVTQMLINLHWLPVVARIEYKVLCLLYKCRQGSAPMYLCNFDQVSS